MNIFTIGFSQKSAEEFFTLLIKNKVNKVKKQIEKNDIE